MSTAVNPKDKVALVTGSSSGIGTDVARCLAKRGVNVILTGNADKSLVTNIVEEIRSYGVRADYVFCDLSKTSNVNSLWSEVLSLYNDGIDILINNAGIIPLSYVENFPDEKYEAALAINLTAPFRLTKLCLPGMKKKGWGRIINVSSTAGHISVPLTSVYTATKHGIIGFTKGVALETAQCGITCNAVCPGTTDTPMLDSIFDQHVAIRGVPRSELKESFLSAQPIGKLITSEQVGELVEFLCLSNASSQMTGASYLIDGGWIAQ